MGSARPVKRVKLDDDAKKKLFTSAGQIQASLRSADNDTNSVNVITALRSQFHVNTDEIVSPKDSRLLLLCEWVSVESGLQRLFDIWSSVTQRHSGLHSLLPSLLCSVLTLLNAHYTNHQHGLPIIKTLLSPSWMRKINSALAGNLSSDATLHSLRLLNAISTFSGGKEKVTLLEAFHWDLKVFHKLLSLRRKPSGLQDPLHRPDIRTLTLMYILSFITSGTSSTLKTTFLTTHRNVFLAIWKGLGDDPYSVIKLILESCWEHILSDVRVARNAKISIFAEVTIAHILKVYVRNEPEDVSEQGDHVPADLAHHFLLAVMTRPGQGICFQDKGWYPRAEEASTSGDQDAVDEGDVTKKGVYNKILANVLKTLKVGEDTRQQELALKVFESCPELVAGYWSSAGLTLNPRLSSRWIANISFVGNVISLPIPTRSFLLSSSISDPSSFTHKPYYNPAPPPLPTIVANIIPTPLTKPSFTKGLASPTPSNSSTASRLVQHCTAIILIKCLSKLHTTLEEFGRISTTLEERDSSTTEETGQWTLRAHELRQELRKRLPDFSVIVAFARELSSDDTNQRLQHADGATVGSLTRNSLLGEMSQRITWLYHACLPESLRDSNLDPGKLLFGTDTVSSRDGLSVLKTLHTLRILDQSREGWSWSGKPSGSNKSYIHTLLKILCASPSLSLRHASESLLMKLFADSALFNLSSGVRDNSEVAIWLEAFQATHSDSDDSVEHLVSFFEDCIQRCLKTPYRYLEEMHRTLTHTTAPPSSASTTAVPFSPLLATVMEQLSHKLRPGATYTLDSPSTVAVCRLLGRLLVGLIGFTDANGLLLLEDSANTVRGLLKASQRTDIEIADQQLRRVQATLQVLHQASRSQENRTMTPVEDSSDDDANRFTFVYEYTQWLRERRTMARESVDSLDSQTLARTMIEKSFTSPCNPPLTYTLRAIRIVSLSLPLSPTESSTVDGLNVLEHILLRSADRLQAEDLATIKSTIFNGESRLRELFLSEHLSPQVCEVTNQVITSILGSAPFSSDQNLVAGITEVWTNRIAAYLQSQSKDSAPFSCAGLIWIQWFNKAALLKLLDDVCAFANRQGQASLESSMPLISSVVDTLDSSRDCTVITALASRKSTLYSLRRIVNSLPTSKPCVRTLDNVLLKLAANAVLPLTDGRITVTPLVAAFSDFIKDSEQRFDLAISLGPKDSSMMISVLLGDADEWTETRICAACASLLTGSLKIDDLEAWRPGSWHQHLPPVALTRISRAIAEQARVSGRTLDSESKVFLSAVPPILIGITASADNTQLRRDAVAAIIAIARVMPRENLVKLCELVKQHLQHATSASSVSSGADVCMQLQPLVPELALADELLHEALAAGMRWLVRYISGETWDSEGKNAVNILSSLASCAKAEAYLLDPLLTAAVQHALQEPAIINLCASLLTAGTLKPVAVNRHIQSLLQHPQFSLVCQPLSVTRIPVVSILHGLFIQHPWNTSQPSHLQPLVAIYHGTLSACDQKLLAIFKLFEIHRKSSVGSLLTQWPATAVGAGATSLQALCSLDVTLVLRASLDFPIHRKMEDVSLNTEKSIDGRGVDPLFCLLLFCQMIADCPPKSALTWVELFRTNVVGLVIRCLSSRDVGMRELSLSALSGLYSLLLTADMQEQPHVIHLLDLLRDQIPSDASVPPRLPSYTTLLCFHSLRAIFLPSNFVYPITAKFLLQRPELDIQDIPMFFGMLYSSAEHWKQERVWMLRFLTTGMVGSQEWDILKKRHVWDLLASLFQASSNDSNTRKCILECLANITCCPRASADLLKKSSILSWIELQVANDLRAGEAIAWLRILDNLVLTTRLDVLIPVARNGGSQRISNTMRLLLAGAPLSVFPLLPSSLLQLLLLVPSCRSHFGDLLSELVSAFPQYEVTIQGGKEALEHLAERSSPRPYTALNVYQPIAQPSSERAWGICAEHSWRCVMELGDSKLMRAMIPRMAVLWSLQQQNQHGVGDWIRLEILRNMQTHPL